MHATIDVLNALAGEPVEFDDIHVRLGGPKSTLRIVLRTLDDVGLAYFAEGCAWITEKGRDFIRDHEASEISWKENARHNRIDCKELWELAFGGV